MWYNLGYFVINEPPAPTQGSSQNLNKSPRPTLHSVWFLIKIAFCCWLICSKSFHQEGKWLLILSSAMDLHPSYFEIRTLAHMSPWFWNSSQLHFPSSAVLKARRSLMPRPPLSFGRHTVFKLTQAILRYSKSPPHKNLRWIIVSFVYNFVRNPEKR